MATFGWRVWVADLQVLPLLVPGEDGGGLLALVQGLGGLDDDGQHAQHSHGHGGLLAHGGGEDVVVGGVSQVGGQGVNGALAVDGVGGGKAQEGEHGQAAVLQLLQLSLLGAHAHGVEGEGEGHAGRAGLLVALVALALQEDEGHGLNGSQGLVVNGVLLGTSLPPLGQTHQVSEQDADHGSHGPAAVGQLSLTEPLQGLLVGAQAQGVEAVVTGHAAVQVSGGGRSWVPHLAGSLADHSHTALGRGRAHSAHGSTLHHHGGHFGCGARGGAS
mmetsp:Transcript_34499/g.87173  ORF Transcript_34499/g.87173 Transcript_34499/m.87173 type:complete len:273 (+) Transcript_34499:1880-2698(+)